MSRPGRSRFLRTLLSLIGLLGGLVYAIGVGTGWGVLALVGVFAGALLLFVLGFVIGQNMIFIEASAARDSVSEHA